MSKEILEDFEAWLEFQPMAEFEWSGVGPNPYAEMVVRHTKAFLQWRPNVQLRNLGEEDISSFLVGWYPQQPELPSEAAGELCEAMVEFCLFLGGTWQLNGGPDRGRRLARFANALEGPMLSERTRRRSELAAAFGEPERDLAEVDFDELIAALESAPRERYSSMFAAWRPGSSDYEKAGFVMSMIADARDARTRLFGLHLLDTFDDDVVESYMRQLLDTSAAGHAAQWLQDRGHSNDTIGAFITPAILIDVLSQLVAYPGLVCHWFLDKGDPNGLLEFFWRHPAPETAQVLEVLGRYLPDKALAQHARQAARKHASWMANRERGA